MRFLHRTRPFLLRHLDCLGLRVNFAKSKLSPSKRFMFLGTVIHSVQMTATVSAERAMTIQLHAASFKEGTARPLKAFRSKLSGFTGTLVGSASHATHPVLAEAEGSIRGLVSRMPPVCTHWRRRMCRAKLNKEQTYCQETMSLQRNGRSTCSRFR